jgi:hypothetical protein
MHSISLLGERTLSGNPPRYSFEIVHCMKSPHPSLYRDVESFHTTGHSSLSFGGSIQYCLMKYEHDSLNWVGLCKYQLKKFWTMIQPLKTMGTTGDGFGRIKSKTQCIRALFFG